MTKLGEKLRQNERDRKRQERQDLTYPEFFPLQQEQESREPESSSDPEPTSTVEYGGGDTGGGGASDTY